MVRAPTLLGVHAAVDAARVHDGCRSDRRGDRTSNLTATVVKAITHPDTLSVPSQANAQALDNGDTFVGWGALGRVSEFDPQGKLLFDATLPSSTDTYRGYRFQWTGRPDTLPTLIAHHAGRYAIWNGATEVARWRILAGRSAAKLSSVRTVAWNGLDTAIKTGGVPKEVQIVALDARGSVIATSKPVGVH